MTDILSLLAQTHHKSPSKRPLASHSDPQYDNLFAMLTPLRQSLDASPYRQKIQNPQHITEDKQSAKKEVLISNQGISKNYRVHKSIAENLFSGYNNVKEKKKVNAHMARERNKNNNGKIQYSPEKCIAQQVKKYIEKREHEIKKSEVVVPSKDKENQNSESLLKSGRVSIDQEKRQKAMLKQQSQHKFGQVLKSNSRNNNIINTNRTLVHQIVPVLQEAKAQKHQKEKKDINLSNQHYQSNCHYRSRSSLGLKNQDLPSTQWLNDFRNSPIYKRKRQQSLSQSPRKSFHHKNKISVQTDNESTRVGQHSCLLKNDQSEGGSYLSSIRRSIDETYKRKRQPSFDLSTKTQEVSKTQPKHSLFRKTTPAPLIRNSISTFPVIEEQFLEEQRVSVTPGDMTFIMQPIQGSNSTTNKQNSWMQQQVNKDKSRLVKNYSLYMINKSTKIQKQ